MLKKCTVAAAVAALSLTSAAFASEGTTSSTASASDTSVAATPSKFSLITPESHAYVSAQGGYSVTQFSSSDDVNYYEGSNTFSSSLYGNNDSGLAARLAGGYQFNQYFGVETGIARYANSKIKSNFSNSYAHYVYGSANQSGDTSTTLKPVAIDILATGTLPLNQYFLFAKGGLAWVHVNYNSNTTDTTTVGNASTSTSSSSADNNNFYRPEIALGAGYNINENFSVDVSASRIFGKGNLDDGDNYLPNLSLYSVGVNYSFA